MPTDHARWLEEFFTRLPGIGPRQAHRFVFFLLNQSQGTLNDLARAVTALKRNTQQCRHCFRFFQSSLAVAGGARCPTCTDKTRERTLLIVEKDADFEAVEKTGIYHGYYFILGGLIPPLEKAPPHTVRVKELEKRIREDEGLTEIIFALSANAIGDNTVHMLKEKLGDTAARRRITVSTLGRGLSTGTELEYSDADTIKNALRHRE